MAVSRLPGNPDIYQVQLQALVPCQFDEKVESARQIAAHLRKILETHGSGNPPSVRIPSAIELAGFYHRSILDVLDGLFELKNQHYEYVMNGLDAEVILHDPLARKRNGKVHPKGSVSRESWSPWDAIKHHPRNPLTDLFPRKVR